MTWAFVLGFVLGLFLGSLVALIGLSLARMGSESGVHQQPRTTEPQ